jgi:hypothetical protein
MAKTKPFKHDPQWARAKQLCRLNLEDIRMAKELGMTPKSLIKNRPNPSEQWKAPVKVWIRELHAKRFGTQTQEEARQPPVPSIRSLRGSEPDDFDEEVPF